ncbi:hypothetical protein TWF102_005501 [Orbilia oligospora]|uniref:Solute carrier family 25 member 38 homolog n=1 Tax=Orbilia oligospora TaxID=2813651 RepID=A0A7C8JS94_ORBOL|nr:hypothetical protein TWF102_005501 [Orbilia oligospora]KAF3100798.1 hypothetical protein TWF103_008109 [Orbilia oligospora]KAF3128373.1 hypothetical protein TWF703_009609 [Orbilia oligospora]KAF3132448.1 hypothetical protein TWF594_009576 [Orbilia oligospora]
MPASSSMREASSNGPVASTAVSTLTLTNNLKHFSSGLAGGIVSAIVLQPADLLKTRVQQSHDARLIPTVRAILSGPNPISTLWRGSIPSAIRTGVGSGLYFATLNIFRKTVHNSTSTKPSTVTNLLTGSAARVFAGFVMMPITIIKVRYESTFYSYNSIPHACRDIFAKEGVRGFFSGLGATAIRDGPSGERVGVVDHEQSAALVNLSSGLTAGVLATAATNPFDALKTRIQLFPETYTNLWIAGRKVIGEEGFMALFDGLGLRMGRKALSSAVMWTAYEEGMRRWALAAKQRGGNAEV